MYAVGFTHLLLSLFSDYKSSLIFNFFLTHRKDFFSTSSTLLPENLIYCPIVILWICCHGSQIFKRNAITYRVMFSYHSLILHLMLLLSEKINNRLAIWNVSGMFGKVDCKVSNHIEGVILSIQVSKVLLTSYHTNHKEVAVGSRGCREIKYFAVTLYFLRILKMF